MDDLKMVIDALEQCLNTPRCQDCSWESCNRIDCQRAELPMDLVYYAFDILKAQIPRVMTLEEIKDGESYWFRVGKDFVTRPVICVHREDDARKQYITFVGQFGTFSCEIDDYGKTWSCWTARPTEEQM